MPKNFDAPTRKMKKTASEANVEMRIWRNIDKTSRVGRKTNEQVLNDVREKKECNKTHVKKENEINRYSHMTHL